MQKVIKLHEYQEKRARERVQGALELMYLEILDHLRLHPEVMEPTSIEQLLIDIIADHVMGCFDGLEDLDSLADRYNAFEDRIRQAIYLRISEFKP